MVHEVGKSIGHKTRRRNVGEAAEFAAWRKQNKV